MFHCLFFPVKKNNEIVQQKPDEKKELKKCGCDANAYDAPPDEVIHLRNAQTKQEATFERRGTNYILGGDMIFTPEQFAIMKEEIESPVKVSEPRSRNFDPSKLFPANKAITQKIISITGKDPFQKPAFSHARTFTDRAVKLWPNRTVPYIINAGIPSWQAIIINSAMAHWQTNTNITFVPRTNEADYVEFVPNNFVCASNVGRIGGRQEVLVVQACDFIGLTHEIGHTLGLFHEHQRADRDEFITVHTQNIHPDRIHNFTIYGGESGFQIGTLDFNSIMLYPSNAFPASPGLLTMTQNPNNTFFDPAPTGLSQGDIETYNYMYNPFFISIREVLSIDASDFGPDYYSWHREGLLYADFYADAARTVPFTLTNRVKLRVGNWSSNYPGDPGSYNEFDVILQPGMTTQLLGDYKDLVYNDRGNFIVDEKRGAGVFAGVGYIHQ